MTCTLIIPTYNRPECLSRVLKYFLLSNSITKIIVADSSFTDVKNKNKEIISTLIDDRIIYKDKYNPDINPHLKFADALSYVDSKYAVFCADDDFLSLQGINTCIEFLESNSDYVAAQGSTIQFYVDSKSNLKMSKNLIQEESIDSNNSFIRLYTHLSKYKTPTMFAVHKTAVLRRSLNCIKDYTDDGRFGELLPSMVTVIHGKFKVLNTVYSFREYNVHSGGHTCETIYDFINNGTFALKYNKFKKCIIEELISKEDISIKQAQKLIDKAMGKYLGSTLLKIRSKFIIKKIFGESKLVKTFINIYHKLTSKEKQSQQQSVMQPVEWKNPETPYYQEINRVKEALENHTK